MTPTSTSTSTTGFDLRFWQSAWAGHPWFGLAARLYLGVVFLLACAHKLAEPESFAVDIATYQFLPLVFINAFALLLPMVELVAGVMFVVGFRVRAAALLMALMMLAFMIGLSHALALGLDMSCGCFASSEAAEGHAISGMTLLRDAAWLGLSLYVLVYDRRPLGVDRWASGREGR